MSDFPYVPPSGPPASSMFIVGEAPGADEARLHEPFVGQSGKELTKMLHEAGIIRSDCRIINVVPYRPPNNDISFFISDKPTPQHSTSYRSKWLHLCAELGLRALYTELLTAQPKVVIPLGATALWALTGESAISKWRGSILRPVDVGMALTQLGDGPTGP